MPNILAQFVNFTSLLFVSFTDFIVPWALYIQLQSDDLATIRDGSINASGTAAVAGGSGGSGTPLLSSHAVAGAAIAGAPPPPNPPGKPPVRDVRLCSRALKL